jgi:ribosomal protein S27AE
MARREIDPGDGAQARDEDWEGNNAAFTCPRCGKVFIVTNIPGPPKSHIDQSKRECPVCQKSTGHVTGGKKGGAAYIEW